MPDAIPVHPVPAEKQSTARIERELFELQSIYDTAPVGLCIFDTDLRYKRINRRLAEINGLPVEAHIGKTVREVLPRIADFAESLLKKIMETGEPLLNMELEGETAAKPGMMRYWLENWYPLKAEDGAVTGINVTVEEITDRKRAEEELSISHRRMREILSSIQDDFYVLDRDWRFVFASEKFTGRIGKRPKDFLGNVIWRMFPKHLGTVLEENFRAAMDGREIRRFEVGGKYTGAMYRMTAFPSAEGITVLGTEITEQKLAEERLNRQNSVLSAVTDILRAALTCRSEEELGTLCLSVLERITGSGFGFIGELNPETGLLDDIAVSDPGWAACLMPTSGSRGGKLPAGLKVHGVCGRVLIDGKPLFTNDPASHPDSLGTPPGHPRLTAFLGIPLEKNGKTIGMIGLGNNPSGYDLKDVESGQALASVVVQAFSSKRAEDALRFERNKFKAVYDNTPVGISITDSKANSISMNPAALDFHGFASQHQLLSRLEQYRTEFELRYPDGTIIPWDLWPATQAARGVFVRDFEALLFNGRLGTERYLSYTSVPVRDDKGNISSIFFNAVDLTAQKNAERRIQESELFYRQTLESIPGMVFTTRPDGYCDYNSRQWAEFTGAHLDEFTGDGWLRLLHPDDRQRTCAAWHDAVAGKSQYNLEYRVRRHDGEYEWFKVIGKPIRDASGETIRWFGIAANVDELKKAKDAEHAAKELAERANRAKTEFLAHMSHEIRTPITGIIGMADIILSRIKDPENREYLELIRSSADSLLRVIGDILDLSRIESGVVNLELSVYDVREELKKIVAPFAISARNKGLLLSINIHPGIPECLLADGDKVAQVLRNLIGNAVKYTESGSVTVTVSPAGENGKKKTVRFSVADTGIGIEAEKRQVIFESFVRLRRSVTERNVEGTGLGLTITKRLVELMGGSITVESEPGKGSTFSAALEFEEAERLRSPDNAGTSSLADIPPLSILLVEDNRINQMFLEISLGEAGHRVTIADNGSEALKILSQTDTCAWDLVLMDVQMPIMDGMEATRRIRSLAGSVSRIPIIALTAFAMQGDEQRFRETGMNGYVTKPIDWNELTRVIREIRG